MRKRTVIYTAGLLFFSPLVYTENVGGGATLPSFKAGDPDCELPAGVDTAVPLSGSTASASLLPGSRSLTAPASISRVSNQYSPRSAITTAPARQRYAAPAPAGSTPGAPGPLGPLGPTGPGQSQAQAQARRGNLAGGAPGWPGQGYGQGYPPPPAGGASRGWPGSGMMPSFGWPMGANGAPAAPRQAMQQGQQPRTASRSGSRSGSRSRSGSGSGSGMGMGSGSSSTPRFSSYQQPRGGSGMGVAPVAPGAPAASPGAGFGGAPSSGWTPFGRPGFSSMPMPRPVPYGGVPAAGAPLMNMAAAPQPGGVSAREAAMEKQLQQMEKRLRDLELRLQQRGD